MRYKQTTPEANIAAHLTVVGVLEQELHFLDRQLRILTEHKNALLKALNQHEQIITGAVGARLGLKKPSLHIATRSAELAHKAGEPGEPENVIEQ
jgi:hypothetical protein